MIGISDQTDGVLIKYPSFLWYGIYVRINTALLQYHINLGIFLLHCNNQFEKQLKCRISNMQNNAFISSVRGL